MKDDRVYARKAESERNYSKMRSRADKFWKLFEEGHYRLPRSGHG